MTLCLWVAIVVMVAIGAATELFTIVIALEGNWKVNIWLIPSGICTWLLCVWGCAECLIKMIG